MERPDGPLAWGTFRPSEKESRALWERWNPGAAPPVMVQLDITVKPIQ